MPLTVPGEDMLGVLEDDGTPRTFGESDTFEAVYVLPDTATVLAKKVVDDGIGGVVEEWTDLAKFPCALWQATKITGFKTANEKTQAGALKSILEWIAVFPRSASWVIKPQHRLRIPSEPDGDRLPELYEVIGTDAGLANTSVLTMKLIKLERPPLN